MHGRQHRGGLIDCQVSKSVTGILSGPQIAEWLQMQCSLDIGPQVWSMVLGKTPKTHCHLRSDKTGSLALWLCLLHSGMTSLSSAQVSAWHGIDTMVEIVEWIAEMKWLRSWQGRRRETVVFGIERAYPGVETKFTIEVKAMWILLREKLVLFGKKRDSTK